MSPSIRLGSDWFCGSLFQQIAGGIERRMIERTRNAGQRRRCIVASKRRVNRNDRKRKCGDKVGYETEEEARKVCKYMAWKQKKS